MSIARILIVEDDAMVRQLLVRHFQKRGVVAVEAASAEEALSIFQQPDQSFDAVLTDVHLGQMSGVDLATRIRSIRAQQPIVFVTGDVDEELARRALAAGNAGYLLKPFEFFELDAALEQAVRLPRTAPDTLPTTSSQASEVWLLEQRRLLEAAAGRPVSLRHEYQPRGRFSSLGLYLKIGAFLIVLILIALYIGYRVPQEQQQEPNEQQQAQPSNGRTVYVPYQPPEPTEPRKSQGR